jgi:outer membrane receptor protein involved in Fe transport
MRSFRSSGFSVLSALAALSLTWSIVAAPIAASAQAVPATSVTGTVLDERNALPVAGATVVLAQNGQTVATTTTDGFGHYTIASISPGVYSVVIRAAGYSPSQSADVAVVAGSKTTIDATLQLSATSAQTGLTTIGHTSTTANALTAATTISQSISTENLTRTGQIRIGDQLGTLPGVNFSTSSSVGDDASVSLRGFGPDETASLLDGHPVGPLGVGSGGFNFSLGPAFGLSQVDVTYGSGAQGLYGSDTIGGAINYVTIGPTLKPQYSFQEQIGGAGIRSTGLTATGTTGKFGYAFAAGRLGEYGDFYPGAIPQAARPNNVDPSSVNPYGGCQGQSMANGPNDVSQCNLAQNTYAVSQNTEQSLLLGKVVYSLSNATKVTGTVYDAVQWSDSTGNGDNDYLPYSTRLKQVQQQTSDCTLPGGGAGYTVTTDAAGDTACYTAQQWAAQSYGPDGGGAGRQRSTRMGDYNLDLTTSLGANDFTFDAFKNNYVFWKDSSLAGGIGPTGLLLGAKTYADYYNTTGYLASDEIVTGKNDFSIGYTLWHQLQTGNEDDINGVIPNTASYFGEWSAFARDNYMFTDRVSGFLNMWLKHSSVSGDTTFDPRATLQFRPTRNDVLQVTYGRSDGAPSPQLKQIGPVIATDPGASLTSVNCNGYNDIASAANPGLKSESANDFEAGYGHRFGADSNVQLNAYVTHVTNQLFGASEPVNAYGVGNIVFEPNALASYINKFASQCGYTLNNATVLQYLSVSTTYNASSALARGIELSGRARINKIAYVDYEYSVESSAQVGIDNNILENNPTVINGAQLPGIPLHQATLSLDVAPGPYEFRIDNYYVSANNGYNRPAYWHSNAFVSRVFAHGRTLLTLGGTNIFNQAVAYYGLLGLGNVPAANSFNPGLQPANEEFGLPPATLTLTLQQKF